MNQNTAIVRTGRKFEQVLEGACKVFMADGFEGASVDKIAQEAKVSKATLYSYFPDKRLLFMEVARVECARMADDALEVIDLNAPARQVLTMAAHALITHLLSDFAQSIFRVCVAERDRFPELGQAFFAAGPEMGRMRMVAYLELAVARGEFAIPDLGMAADQFTELCKAKLWTRAVLGIQTKFSSAEIGEVVGHAVDMFMARYATGDAAK